MNATKWLSHLLGIGAVLEIPVGLGLLGMPSTLAALLLGAPVSGSGLVVARLAGGGLLALGIACWFARSTPGTQASLGVAWALLTYNIVACATLALLPPETGNQPLALGAAILHGIIAAALFSALVVRSSKRDAT